MFECGGIRPALLHLEYEEEKLYGGQQFLPAKVWVSLPYNVMRKQNLASRVSSWFKKTIAVGTFAAASLIPSTGCISEEEAHMHREIAHSVSNHGRREIQEGKLEEGIKYLKEAANITDPDMFDSYHLGLSYKKKGDLENAEKYFRKATLSYMRDKSMRIEEFRANALFELGLLYLEQENKEKAIEHFRNAIRFNPEHPKAHFHLAKYVLEYHSESKPKIRIRASREAISHLEAAVGIDRDNERYQELFERIREEVPKKGFYFTFNGGIGGTSGARSFGGEWAFTIRDKEKIYSFSFLLAGLSFISNEEPWETDPQYHWSEEVEALVLNLGIGTIKPNYELLVTSTLGFSVQTVGDNDPTTNKALDSRNYNTWSAHLKYIKEGLIISAGYHNRRGFVGSIGASILF